MADIFDGIASMTTTPKAIILIGAGSSAPYGLPIQKDLANLMLCKLHGEAYDDRKGYINAIGLPKELWDETCRHVNDIIMDVKRGSFSTIDKSLHCRCQFIQQMNNRMLVTHVESLYWSIFHRTFYGIANHQGHLDSALVQYVNEIATPGSQYISDKKYHIHHLFCVYNDAVNFIANSTIIDYNYDTLFSYIAKCYIRKYKHDNHGYTVNELENMSNYFNPHGTILLDKDILTVNSHRKSFFSDRNSCEGDDPPISCYDSRQKIFRPINQQLDENKPEILIVAGKSPSSLKQNTININFPNTIKQVFYNCYNNDEHKFYKEYFAQKFSREVELNEVKTCDEIWDKLSDLGFLRRA